MKRRFLDAQIKVIKNCLSVCENQVSKYKVEIEDYRARLKELRLARVPYDHNVETQIILKMGQVEVDLCGDINRDTIDSFLITKSEICRVNMAIWKAGNMRLKTIAFDDKLFHIVRLAAWKHQCHKINIKHSHSYVYHIERFNVTSLIRIYMKNMYDLWDRKVCPTKISSVELSHKVIQLIKSQLIDQWKAKFSTVKDEVNKMRKKNREINEKISEMNAERHDMESKKISKSKL